MCVVFSVFFFFILYHGIFFARAFDLPLGRTKTRRRLRRCELPCKRMLLMSWNAKKKNAENNKKIVSRPLCALIKGKSRGGHPRSQDIQPASCRLAIIFYAIFTDRRLLSLKFPFVFLCDFLCPGVVWFFFSSSDGRSVLFATPEGSAGSCEFCESCERSR